MAVRREYPDSPLVGVGAVILKDGAVLLVKRGSPPSRGKWSLPGGLVGLGESVEEAVVREVQEECGIRIRLRGVAGVVDRVARDPGGRVRYHYVLIDYVGIPEDGTPRAGSDAAEVRWVPIGELDGLDTTEGLAAMIHKAVRVSEGGPTR
ncbi:MAG: NUDIX hydrolase [Candidatus Methylomirabilia bacterium]